jgi:DnaB-like helicase N terminal domain/AAA domain
MSIHQTTRFGKSTAPASGGPGKAPAGVDGIPPHNDAAECYVLGALLLEGARFAEVAGILEPGDFYAEVHQDYFKAMCNLAGRGAPIGPVTVPGELNGTFKKYGGDDFMLDLANSAPHTVDLVYHAHIVKQKAMARELIQAATDIVRDGYSGLFTAGQILTRARGRIDAIAAQARSGEVAKLTPADFATLADVRREANADGWIVRGLIPRSRLFGVAAYEGTGKTRFEMDMARRWWHGLEMPDGEPSPFPEHTPTLWICSDGQQDDILEIADAYEMPDDSFILNTAPEDPYGGTSVDDPESLLRLEAGIACIRPAAVFVSSLTNATARDLCRANETRDVCKPLSDMAIRTKTAIGLECHLALDGKALGKRVRGWTRTMINIECPDPDDHPERLKVWAEKTFAKRPDPMGATMKDGGIDYDHDPPVAPEPPRPRGKGGAPAKAREKVVALITEALGRDNDQIGNELQRSLQPLGVAKTTFWRIAREMETSGDLVMDGGAGTGSQTRFHLNPGPVGSGTEAPDEAF